MARSASLIRPSFYNEQAETRIEWGGGVEASMLADPHPDCHSTVALQPVWVRASLRAVRAAS
jgi:hypothetical protein